MTGGEIMGTKSWWKSKAVWSGIITVVIGTMQAIDANFGTHIVDIQIVGAIITLAGAFGVYGRVAAKDKIE
jgi:hypothetical protein